MPIVPKATVFATATAVARLEALMAGASAVIAVTPQIDVPAVRRAVMSRGKPAMRPASGIKSKPALTDASTTGIPLDPIESSSKKESLAATATIPPWRIFFVENVIPGLHKSFG